MYFQRADFWVTIHNTDFKQPCTKYNNTTEIGSDRLKFSMHRKLVPITSRIYIL